jgi:hypothetical protein
MAHKWAKKSKKFGFHHYEQYLPHVLDEWEANLYKIQEDIVAKFEGGEIIGKKHLLKNYGEQDVNKQFLFSQPNLLLNIMISRFTYFVLHYFKGDIIYFKQLFWERYYVKET